MKFWIKERHNPQIGIYYVACGKLPQREAKKCEESLYGSNMMLSFERERDYLNKIEELKKSGFRVHT